MNNNNDFINDNNKEIQIILVYIPKYNSDLINITNKTDVFGPKISTDSGLKHWFLTRMSKE